MTVVLAALDGSAASQPVLDTAISVAALFGADVRALHVGRGGSEAARNLEAVCAERDGRRHPVQLSIRRGPVVGELLRAIADDEVLVAVLGARRLPGGRRPCGHTAMELLTAVAKPIVVVPPDAETRRGVRRLLLPLEGDDATSRPVLDYLSPLLRGDVELTVMHVFTDGTVPRVLDHPARDLELWGGEFIARHCPAASHIVLHTGPVGARVVDVVARPEFDLVVLSWSRTMGDGHAEVIREVLARSSAPVLLLPAPSPTPSAG